MSQQNSENCTNVIIRKLAIIYNMQVQTSETLEALHNSIKKNNVALRKFQENRNKICDSEDNFDDCIEIPRLPVRTIDELKQFEQWIIKDNANYKKYRKELKLLGRQNFHNQVNNAMSFTMTYDVGKETTWTDFSDKKVAATIRDVIVQQYRHTKTDTEKLMKTWLQESRDRVKFSQIPSPQLLNKSTMIYNKKKVNYS